MTLRGFKTEKHETVLTNPQSNKGRKFGQTTDSQYDIDTKVNVNHNRMQLSDSYSYDAVTDSFGNGELYIFESENYYEVDIYGFIDGDTFSFAGGNGGSVNIDTYVSTPDGDVNIGNIDVYDPDSESQSISYEGQANGFWFTWGYDGGANFSVDGYLEFAEEPEPSVNIYDATFSKAE